MARRIKPGYLLGPQVKQNGTYDLDGQALTETQVDAWLSVLLGIGFVGTLIITGCAAPSVPTGMAAAAALITNGATITSDYAIITQEPTFAVNVDGSWKLTIATHGAGVTYQWQENLGPDNTDINADWEDVGGQNAAQFNNPPIAIDHCPNRISYRCVVTRAAKVVNSSLVTVDVPANISLEQGDQEINTDDPLDFSAQIGPDPASLNLGIGYAAEGSTYQWFKDGVAIPDANGDVENPVGYHVDNATSDNAGVYTLVITAPNGAKVTSTPAATVTVN